MSCYWAAVYVHILCLRITSTDSWGLKALIALHCTPAISTEEIGRKRTKCPRSFKVAQLISSGSVSAALGWGLQSTKSWSSSLGQSQWQARAVSVYFSSVPGNEPFWLWSLGETVECLCKELSEPCKAGTKAKLITLAEVRLTVRIGMSLHLTLHTFGSGNVIKLSFIWLWMVLFSAPGLLHAHCTAHLQQE